MTRILVIVLILVACEDRDVKDGTVICPHGIIGSGIYSSYMLRCIQDLQLESKKPDQLYDPKECPSGDDECIVRRCVDKMNHYLCVRIDKKKLCQEPK